MKSQETIQIRIAAVLVCVFVGVGMLVNFVLKWLGI